MGSLKLTVILTTRSIEMTTTNTDASRTTSVENSRTSENKCTFTPEKGQRRGLQRKLLHRHRHITELDCGQFCINGPPRSEFRSWSVGEEFSTDDQQGYGDHGTVTSFLC